MFRRRSDLLGIFVIDGHPAAADWADVVFVSAGGYLAAGALRSISVALRTFDETHSWRAWLFHTKHHETECSFLTSRSRLPTRKHVGRSKNGETMNDHSADCVELPHTASLHNALKRAGTAAAQRSHSWVWPDHLLLALLDDPDAAKLLRAANADIASIRTAITDVINHKLPAIEDPGGQRQVYFHPKFRKLFAGASKDAERLGRREVDGALAVIAIARESDSYAKGILEPNGFDASKGLQILGAALPAPAQPPQQTAIAQAPLPPQPRQPQPPAARAPVPQAAQDSSEDKPLEDICANVRDILVALERQERAAPPQPPRLEPQSGADTGTDQAEPVQGKHYNATSSGEHCQATSKQFKVVIIKRFFLGWLRSIIMGETFIDTIRQFRANIRRLLLETPPQKIFAAVIVSVFFIVVGLGGVTLYIIRLKGKSIDDEGVKANFGLRANGPILIRYYRGIGSIQPKG